MSIEILAIIPARSGSKGLPGKNIRLLGNKPLLAWTAAVLAEAGLGNCLAILSTDSEIYADVGRQAGLNVPFLRPPECSDDKASAIQVCEHALCWFQSVHHYLPELTMWLQPTSPFRSAAIVRQAVDMLRERQADAVIGCREIHRDLTSLFRCEQGFLAPLDRTSPTQTSRADIQPLLTPNGAMYLCKSEFLLELQSFYPEKTLPLPMNAVQSLDIDGEEDWMIAEAYVHQGLVGSPKI